MSGDSAYPPPGAGQQPTGPEYPPPGHPGPASYAPQVQPGWGPPPAVQHPAPPGRWAPPGGLPLGAAHKPGAVPLRPLTLSDMFDAAFKIIRFNPRATVGSAVLVAAVSMAIPVLVTGGLSMAADLSLDASGGEPTTAELAGLVGALGSLLVGSFLQTIGLVLVTGMVARVCAAAAVGRRLGLVEAWRETRGRRWRLLGLTLLLAGMLLAVVGAYAGLWVGVVTLA